jgi:hypothetical protein
MKQRVMEWFLRQTMFLQIVVLTIAVGVSFSTIGYTAYEAILKLEDTAHVAGEGIVGIGCRRIDTAASSAGTSGDWATIDCDANGALRVRVDSTAVGSASEDDDNSIAHGRIGDTIVINIPYVNNGSAWVRQVVGTAGSASSQVTTVQGIASMTPLQVQSNSANLATQTTAAAIQTAVELIDNAVSGSGLNISQINGVTPLMGAGNTGTGSHRTTEATDSQLSAGVGATGDAAATAGSTGSLNAKGRLITSQLADILTALQLIDNDQTGASLHHRISVGTTEDEHEVKGSAGRLFAINVTNTNAAVRYLRCANQVIGSTTPGTTTVFYGMAIPAATTGGGYTTSFGPKGVAFSTGLTCWLVTGAAETDVAEVAANEINVNYVYE